MAGGAAGDSKEGPWSRLITGVFLSSFVTWAYIFTDAADRYDWWLHVIALGVWLYCIYNAFKGGWWLIIRQSGVTDEEAETVAEARAEKVIGGFLKFAFWAAALFLGYIILNEYVIAVSTLDRFRTLVIVLLVAILFALLRIGDKLRNRSD